MVRTHDVFYLSEDRKDNPKEYFKFLANNVKAALDESEKHEILDVGCATGEFIYYMAKQFPNNNFTGIDILPELIGKAEKNTPSASFFIRDINSNDFNFEKKFDYIFMNGVHSIFNNVEPWLGNLISLKKKEGRIYLFGIFNPEDLDVIIKSKKSSDEDNWESGWNMFSLETMKKAIEKYSSSYKIIPWHLPVDIKKNEDPLRSWTIPINQKEKIVVNGLQIIHHFYMIEIK